MDFDTTLARFSRAQLGAAVIGFPVVLGAVAGVPKPAMLAYLVVALPVYAWFVFRRRPPRDQRRRNQTDPQPEYRAIGALG